MKKVVIIALFVIATARIFAQQSDFVLMPQIGINYALNRGSYVKLMQQVLINQNASEFWMASTDVAYGFRLSKKVSTEAHVRGISFKTPQNTFERRMLFFHTISYSDELGPVDFTIRNRIQQLIFVETLGDERRPPRWYNRLRLNLSYRFNYYYSFGLNSEAFYPLNNPSRKTIDQIRLGVTAERRFNDRIQLALGYQLQQQVARVGNNRFFVASFQTNISL